jgi:hypothetical protein
MEMDAWQEEQIQAMMLGGNAALISALQEAGYTGQMLEIQRAPPNSSELEKRCSTQLKGLYSHIIASKYNSEVASILRERLNIARHGDAGESLPIVPQLDHADLVTFRQKAKHVCKYFFPPQLWEAFTQDKHGAQFFTIRIAEVKVDSDYASYCIKVRVPPYCYHAESWSYFIPLPLTIFYTPFSGHPFYQGAACTITTGEEKEWEVWRRYSEFDSLRRVFVQVVDHTIIMS